MMATVAEQSATEAPLALPRATWRDIVLPVLLAVLLLTAFIAIALAMTVFAADPMAGT